MTEKKPIHLAELGCINVTGVDAETFLQGQVTCDINKVDANSFLLGCYCNPQGRIINLFRITRWEDGFVLLTMRNSIAHTLEKIRKYAMFSKVELTDASDEIFAYQCCSECDNPKLIYADDRSIMLSTKKLNAEVDNGSWHLTDIMAGLPNIQSDAQEKFIPQRLNLEELGALDFKKGCYAGQEIIARLHYKGKVKHRMYYYQLEGDAELTPGMVLQSEDGSVKGDVVDTVLVKGVWHTLLILQMENHPVTELIAQSDEHSGRVRCAHQ